jgi:hypothetical protein
MPFVWLVRCHAAANHTVSGVRVAWKMVPQVTETRWEQREQNDRPLP